MGVDGNIVEITDQNFAETIEESTGLAMIDFWAEWCGPCRMIGPVLDEVAAEVGDRAKICKVNVDEETELAGKFGVRSIPLLLFIKDGDVKDQVIGASTSKDGLIQKLDALAEA